MILIMLLIAVVCLVLGGLALYAAAAGLIQRDWGGVAFSALVFASCMLAAAWLLGVVCG